ncbi:glycosyltransferase family 2 protein [Tropicibacter sp. S64]|uniref:glycosyltransferase family 2 protein n=1 Tax=Tropicibacter sp. S64 TaxID=3415122 RepID=UPI003C7D77B7
MALRFSDVRDQIALIGPALDPGKVTVFSIFRDEMYFLPAFFDHYRGLGVEQFVIVDDHSEDGTTAYLDAQDDCIRVHSALRYGSEIEVLEPSGRKRMQRAGVYFKGAIPQALMPGRFTTYVDADEFLILPPGVSTLGEVEARLRADGDVAALAPMVEFFPADVAGFGVMDAPTTFTDLLARSPFFEAAPLIMPNPGVGKPTFLNQSKSVALMEAFDVLPAPPARSLVDRILGRKPKKSESFFQSARHKTPIVCHSEQTFMVGTHDTNRVASQTVMPALAHFVFTPQFGQKVQRALDWGSHAHGASKYRFYAALLKKMAVKPDAFLGPQSIRYEGPEQFMDAGLIRW